MLKRLANVLAFPLVLAPAITCWLEAAIGEKHEGMFNFWTHVLAILPGHPGLYLRRTFYWLTLHDCALDFFIGFGALFTHRRVVVERHVYVGPYAVVGSVCLRTGCLIGTRANLLSGSMQHVLDGDGRWQPVDLASLPEIEIGEHAWIGEAATIMGSIGAGSVVAAGAVVSAPVPPGIVVAGNPARFVRKVRPEPMPADIPQAEDTGREPLAHSSH